MATNLCIDWGNSRVKIALFGPGDQLVENHLYNEQEASQALQNIIEQRQPQAAIFCSVSNDTAPVVAMLREKVQYFVQLDSNTNLPIMNAYHTPETLGADRLALVVGAYMQFPSKNNLVISLGTCITYNFVHSNKAFRGGAISPGLHMRFQAMHAFTGKLPEVKPEGDLLLMGYDTDTAMRSGVINGMTYEIDGMIDAYAAQYPDFNAVLTGGDAALFGSKIKNKIFADPNLLLKGLNLILKHNVPQIR